MVLIIFVIIALLVVWFICTYNCFISLKNKVMDQWSQIDVQLKRRADLIPNLVKTVKGYVKHEKETLKDIVDARNLLEKSKTPEDEMKVNDMVSRTVSKVIAVAEAYPDLKSNENFISLQDDLSEIEDKISMMRQFYNDIVMKYNNKIESIPSNIVASICGFRKQSFFEIDDKERDVVEVSID